MEQDIYQELNVIPSIIWIPKTRVRRNEAGECSRYFISCFTLLDSIPIQFPFNHPFSIQTTFIIPNFRMNCNSASWNGQKSGIDGTPIIFPLSLQIYSHCFEACLLTDSVESYLKMQSALLFTFQHSSSIIIENSGLFDLKMIPKHLSEHIQKISISLDENEEVESTFSEEEGNEESSKFCKFRTIGLPHTSLEGLWENLMYDEELKPTIMNYVKSSIEMSEKGIDDLKVAWSRLLLLTGAPGTGKTSLCKALCQKLSIHLFDKYCSFELIELNSQSIFSKWYSESGKLVAQVFKDVRQLANQSFSSPSSSTYRFDNNSVNECFEDMNRPTDLEMMMTDQNCELNASSVFAAFGKTESAKSFVNKRFVFLLIDEVESLTMSRSKSMNSSEPTDSLRVVNTILMELDRLRHLPNVFVLTTSNLVDLIDAAFLDRVDMVFHFGLPGQAARFEILTDAIEEMLSKKILKMDFSDDMDSANFTVTNKNERNHKNLKILASSGNHSSNPEFLQTPTGQSSIGPKEPLFNRSVSTKSSIETDRIPLLKPFLGYKPIQRLLHTVTGHDPHSNVQDDHQTNISLCNALLNKTEIVGVERMSIMLWKISWKCGFHRMSGRALRRQPFVTYAKLSVVRKGQYHIQGN